MSNVIPDTMRASIVQEGGKVAVQEVPVPVLKSNEILVKVYAVAQNPTDWKKPGTIIGVDFSGIVAKLGDDVSNVKIGDHVSGFTHGGYYTDYGAFAEYTKVESDFVWIVPPGTVTHEEAATMNCGVFTVIQAFYHPSRLGLPNPPTPPTGKWFFVYAGSTSVGLYAIQFARLSGFKVVTVASPRNHKLVTDFGADAYKDPDVVEKIRNVTGNSIQLALDTNADETSQLLTVRTFGPEGGHLIVILPPREAAVKERPDVKIQFTLLYTALGREFSWPSTTFPAAPEDRAHQIVSLVKFSELVKAGYIRPNPVKIWEGGLEAVQEGFDYMREGKLGARYKFEIHSNVTQLSQPCQAILASKTSRKYPSEGIQWHTTESTARDSSAEVVKENDDIQIDPTPDYFAMLTVTVVS
ncbi:hypothetical protein Clacol_010424 [Clathrus columnatus]|uniref:Enoyl reductase (ER) domain-containing protein n=1 Tax=Clathrus columnatus TaxID=1419009 RepID=A0AAV5ASL5_9AGAM|nr:hypothetical protein Clacol_010424 [Clathrus columnatus]